MYVCHLILTCSGFPIPHGEERQRELATRIWKWDLHISTLQSINIINNNKNFNNNLHLNFYFPKILIKPSFILGKG